MAFHVRLLVITKSLGSNKILNWIRISMDNDLKMS
jgi:hypothetical protein